MRAHCPERRLSAPVGLSTTMCLHISWYSLTKSLNANTNVRNMFFKKYIYPRGVRNGKGRGGFPVECIWKCGLERIRERGVGSCQVGVGYGWGYEYAHVYTPSCSTGIFVFKRFASTSSTLALALSNSFMCPASSRFN